MILYTLEIHTHSHHLILLLRAAASDYVQYKLVVNKLSDRTFLLHSEV